MSVFSVCDSSPNQIKRLLTQSRWSNGITDSLVWTEADVGREGGERDGSNGLQREQQRGKRKDLLHEPIYVEKSGAHLGFYLLVVSVNIDEVE